MGGAARERTGGVRPLDPSPSDPSPSDPSPSDPSPSDPSPSDPSPHELRALSGRGAGRRQATEAERRALASVLRLRILRLCLYEPLTNRAIAERLGRNPATVLHHVRTLVDHGFLVADQARRGPRGSREIPYRATGKSWTLDLNAGPAAGPPPLLQAFAAEVAMVPESSISASRLGLQLSPEHEQELRDRLAAVLDEFARRPQDPGGARWSVFLAIHPEP